MTVPFQKNGIPYGSAILPQNSPWRKLGNRSVDSLTDVTGSVNVGSVNVFFASFAQPPLRPLRLKKS